MSFGRGDRPEYLPISTFQRLMLEAAEDPGASFYYHQNFLVQIAFRITPSVSERLLSRAFKKLVSRHESLRLKFEKVGDEWRAVVRDSLENAFFVHNLGHCAESDLEASISEITSAEMMATSPRLFELHLLKCGQLGDVVLIRAQHAIVDGHGLVLVIEELLKLALNIPVAKEAGSHKSFASRIDHERRVSKSRAVAYWHNKLLPVPEPLEIGRVAKNLEPIGRSNVGSTIDISYALSETESRQITNLAKRLQSSAFACLHTAFCAALCEISGGNEVVACSWLGQAFSSEVPFVGSDIQLFAVKYVHGKTEFDDAVRKTASQIASAPEGLPTDTFLPGNELAKRFEENGNSLYRFCIHNSLPSGKMSKSDFRRLLWNGLNGRVSLGFAAVERIPIKRESEGECEIYVVIDNLKDGPNFKLVADASAYDLMFLQSIVDKMKNILDL